MSEVLGWQLILVYELVTLVLSASCFWRLAAFLSCHSFGVVIAGANKRTGCDHLVCRPANIEYCACHAASSGCMVYVACASSHLLM